MSGIVVSIGDRRYTTRGRPVDISIPLDFDGLQPNFYDATPATARPMHSGDFIGDTRLGGSCNAAHVDLTTHCNGTHTECVGHITHERVSVHGLALEPVYPCLLLSVDTMRAHATEEHGGAVHTPDDRLITRRSLERAAAALDDRDAPALAVRTLPNPKAKRTRVYDTSNAAYFTVEAMQWIVDRGVEHLLVDTPSVDRLDDGGRLTAHRIFWAMKPGSRHVDDAARREATITELIYVPAELVDGLYLLALQVAPFVSDAAPSRPLLYAIDA